MGMSASDAAPLPRLGEIFFDVRGSSRSMRLSWYSNTGIAVFSIWQGGTCTGTFRLPMDDLTRLVDSLRRGVPAAEADDELRPDRARRPASPAGDRRRARRAVHRHDDRADRRAGGRGYGRSSGRRTGGFATVGPDQARSGASAEPVSLSDYAGSGAAEASTASRTSTARRPARYWQRGAHTARGSSTARRSVRRRPATTRRAPTARAQYGSPDQYGARPVRQRDAVRQRARSTTARHQYDAARSTARSGTAPGR